MIPLLLDKWWYANNILVSGAEVRSLIALEANILMTPRGLPSLLIKGGGESLMRHPLVGAAFLFVNSFPFEL